MQRVQPAVYILASHRDGTLYIGATSHLRERVWQHRSGMIDGFTKRYGIRMLVYFEFHPDMPSAIAREKKIKKWRRAWKVRLIQGANPDWKDRWTEVESW